MTITAKNAVASRFRKLLSQLPLTEADKLIYNRHRITVTKRLRSSFKVNRIAPIGSSSRDTSIRVASDIDLMLVLNVAEVRWGSGWKSSYAVLNNVRDQLQDRYTTTEVGRDAQAIVVDFDGGEYPVDVVPTVYSHSETIRFSSTDIKQYPVFQIPDGEGDWMPTSPLAHTRYLNLQNLRTWGKLYNVAKLLKFWRYCRTPPIPLNSFHVELLLARQEICIGTKTYGECLYDAFAALSNRECCALQDPIGIAGLVKAANTDAKRERTLEAITSSLQHASSALDAERDGDTEEALWQWNIVFNYEFPTRLRLTRP